MLPQVNKMQHIMFTIVTCVYQSAHLAQRTWRNVQWVVHVPSSQRSPECSCPKHPPHQLHAYSVLYYSIRDVTQAERQMGWSCDETSPGSGGEAVHHKDQVPSLGNGWAAAADGSTAACPAKARPVPMRLLCHCLLSGEGNSVGETSALTFSCSCLC